MDTFLTFHKTKACLSTRHTYIYGEGCFVRRSDTIHIHKWTLFTLSGDSLSGHKDKPFSTKDADHDIDGGSCSSLYHGAWWYRSCYESNLNGQYYQEGESVQNKNGLAWNSWKGSDVSYKTVTMKVRPAGFTPGETLMSGIRLGYLSTIS